VQKQQPSWKSFEALIERLEKAFHPNATIVKNDHLPGHDSGRSREIDVSIRYKLGATCLLIVVDCKKRTRKIDLPEVHAFHGLMTDVRANAGSMVCEKGFSKSAKRLAAQHNIELFTFQDTQHPNWQLKARIPVCVEQWVLTPIALNVKFADGSIHPIADEKEVEVTDIHTGGKSLCGDLAAKLWNDHPDKKNGPVVWELDARAINEETNSNASHKLQIGVDAKLHRFTRWAQLALVGLTKVEDGLTYTDAFDIITNDEPAAFLAADDKLLPAGDYPFGVLVKTAVISTTQTGRKKIDLERNSIKLSLAGKPSKPISIRLPPGS
jgi:hypothetical protein